MPCRYRVRQSFSVAGGSGDWTVAYTGTPLTDGPYAVTATATDGANTSAASTAFALTIDTGTPAASTILGPWDQPPRHCRG